MLVIAREYLINILLIRDPIFDPSSSLAGQVQEHGYMTDLFVLVGRIDHLRSSGIHRC